MRVTYSSSLCGCKLMNNLPPLIKKMKGSFLMCCCDLSMFNTMLSEKKNRNEIPATHFKPVGTGVNKILGKLWNVPKKMV